MMVLFFWLCSIAMILIAYSCFLPWVLKDKSQSFVTLTACIACLLFVPIFAYSFYGSLGNAEHLSEYYSTAAVKTRARHQQMRPLLSTLSKEEVKLRLRLEEYPEDILAQCKLLDVYAIFALQSGDIPLAKRYWQEALAKSPSTEEGLAFRKRIKDLQARLQVLKE